MDKLSNQKNKKNIYTIEDLGFPSKINSVYPKSKGNIKYFSNLDILKKSSSYEVCFKYRVKVNIQGFS